MLIDSMILGKINFNPQKLKIMKKKKLGKLNINKSTISGVGVNTIQGGISGGACQPIGPVPFGIGCPPHSIPNTNCICTGDRMYFDRTCGSSY